MDSSILQNFCYQLACIKIQKTSIELKFIDMPKHIPETNQQTDLFLLSLMKDNFKHQEQNYMYLDID
jgi:hypothetical protein